MYLALVLVTSSYCHLCIPAGFTEKQGMNNRHTWRNHSLLPEQHQLGPWGQKQDQCGQLQEGTPSPQAGSLLFPATWAGSVPLKMPTQGPCAIFNPLNRPVRETLTVSQTSHQARSSLGLSCPHGVSGGSGYFLPAFAANPWLPESGHCSSFFS